jgi:hypothetical protein
MGEALRTQNTSIAAFDLMQRDVCPPALESYPYLSRGLKSLQARFVEILEREGFTLSARQGATVLFKFDQNRLDDFCCECHAKLVTLNGREYMAAVNYLGKSIVPQFAVI